MMNPTRSLAIRRMRDEFLGGARQMGGSMSPGRMPAATEASTLEDQSFKSARISVEERREKIHRYIKKRNERNFSKKIKVTPPPTHKRHSISNGFKIQLGSFMYVAHGRHCDLCCAPTMAVRLQEDTGGQQAPRARQIRQERRLRRHVKGDAGPRRI